MNTDNNKPLYKVLNSSRTQGNWYFSQMPITYDFSVQSDLDKSVYSIARVIHNEETELPAGRKEIEANTNAEYITLAVNNLDKVADTSSNLHSAVMELYKNTNIVEWWKKHGNTVAKAKEALKNIS
jgi:hypothetical protein